MEFPENPHRNCEIAKIGTDAVYPPKMVTL